MEIVQALKDQRNFALVQCKRTSYQCSAIGQCTTVYNIHSKLHETEPWGAAVYIPTATSPSSAVQCMLNWALCTSTPKPPGWSRRLKTTGKEERIWQFQISVWSYIIVFLNCHVNILQIISTCGWKAYSDFKKSVMGVFLTHKILPGSDISKWGWERIFKEKYFK